jgi:hypothetical protein
VHGRQVHLRREPRNLHLVRGRNILYRGECRGR